MGYIDHAVKRGLEHPATARMFKRAVEEAPKVDVPGWGIAVLALTFLSFFVGMSLLEYTLKDVIATLAMVETPAAAITVSPSNDESAVKSDKEGLLETGPTITLVHQKPITSSIRATIRHLVSQAGRWSRFRGFKAAALHSFAYSTAANVLTQVIPHAIPGRLILISGIAGALTANLHAVWTHKVVAMPSTKSFWQRVPSRTFWKQLALPAAIKASAGYMTFYIAHGSCVLMGLNRLQHENVNEYNQRQWTSLIVRMISVVVISLLCSVFIVIPASVTLVRVEASILPEEDDTIVPFDRTFAGKVVPKILGGTGAIGFVDAWRSFNWEARRRLIKLYVKIFLIVVAAMFVLAHVLALETWVIMGPAVGKMLAQARQQGF